MEDVITLAHGNGGRRMRHLIETLFAAHLGAPDIQADAAVISLPPGEVLVTTDGFTVQPLQFPGGDIGALAVHGTVNDLAVSGATPVYLTLGVLVEEGFPLAMLETVISSLGEAARSARVRVAAGDTKVLPRGQGGGVYLTVTGIGVREAGRSLGIRAIRPGDRLLLSGPVGDHGIAVMLAREAFGLRGDIRSDAASVLPLTIPLLDLPGLRFMRDPTRGGLATVAHEIAHASGLGVCLEEKAIPLRSSTRAVCAMLGFDPLYLACEGRVLAALAPEDADAALAMWRALPEGVEAALIGTVQNGPGPVTLRTPFGGQRILPELEEDALPRIC